MSDDRSATSDDRPRRPLRVAVLVKQVPLAEELELGPDGRLRRRDAQLEMNPYCRRAVTKGIELARSTGGTCSVFSLGPPSAEDVVREAVAGGADGGVLLSDPAFAGSDTLATARALAAGLRTQKPFDLVLVGRNTTDGDTGQVGPELAQLLDLPFAAGARRMQLAGDVLELGLEQDDGWEEAVVTLPAVVSVAERLCEPCKVGPEGRAAVPAARIRRVTAADLGAGPWGEAGSPTRVGAVRVIGRARDGRVLAGPLADQVAEAVRVLGARGALAGHPAAGGSDGSGAARAHARPVSVETTAGAPTATAPTAAPTATAPTAGRLVTVLLEPGRPRVGAELLGAAARLADDVGGAVVAVVPPVADAGRRREVVPAVGGSDSDETLAEALGELGADLVLRADPPEAADVAPEDVAQALVRWAGAAAPWAVLAPGTAFGREVAARMAAALGAGLVGDAVAVDVADGRMVAAKPAFSGGLVADISCTSPLQLVTVRPGVLEVPVPVRRSHGRSAPAGVEHIPVGVRGRMRTGAVQRDDDVEVLARAPAVIGVGTGVAPDEYELLSPLAAVLGAELAATRKVTDRGWAPRSRQVGITGRSISPRLYVAIGLAGKFNHMVGVRAAGTVLAVNADAGAPVFAHADVGIVADWREVLPLLTAALRDHRGAEPTASFPAASPAAAPADPH